MFISRSKACPVACTVLFILTVFAMTAAAKSSIQIAFLEMGTDNHSTTTNGAINFSGYDPNLMVRPVLSLNSPNQGQPGGVGFMSSRNWIGLSLDQVRYWTFTLTPSPGFNVRVTSITLKGARAFDGPGFAQLRTAPFQQNQGNAVSGLQGNTADIVFNGFLVDVNFPLEFRVYGWGGSATGAWNIGNPIDGPDISVMGEVIPTAPVSYPVSGRVLTLTGMPIAGARMTLTDATNVVRGTATSNSSGYYCFYNVLNNVNYTVSGVSKRYILEGRTVFVIGPMIRDIIQYQPPTVASSPKAQNPKPKTERSNHR